MICTKYVFIVHEETTTKTDTTERSTKGSVERHRARERVKEFQHPKSINTNMYTVINYILWEYKTMKYSWHKYLLAHWLCCGGRRPVQ